MNADVHWMYCAHDPENAADTGGFGPLAYSCAAGEAVSYFNLARLVLRPGGGMGTPRDSFAYSVLPTGQELVVWRYSGRDSMRRGNTETYALYNDTPCFSPSLALGLTHRDCFPQSVAVGTRLPPLRHRPLYEASLRGGDRLRRGLADHRDRIGRLLAWVLSAPGRSLTTVDEMLGEVPRAVLMGVLEIAEPLVPCSWTFSTGEQDERGSYWLVVLADWPVTGKSSHGRKRLKGSPDGPALEASRRLLDRYLQHSDGGSRAFVESLRAESGLWHALQPEERIRRLLDTLSEELPDAAAPALPAPPFPTGPPAPSDLPRLSAPQASSFPTDPSAPPVVPRVDGETDSGAGRQERSCGTTRMTAGASAAEEPDADATAAFRPVTDEADRQARLPHPWSPADVSAPPLPHEADTTATEPHGLPHPQTPFAESVHSEPSTGVPTHGAGAGAPEPLPDGTSMLPPPRSEQRLCEKPSPDPFEEMTEPGPAPAGNHPTVRTAGPDGGHNSSPPPLPSVPGPATEPPGVDRRRGFWSRFKRGRPISQGWRSGTAAHATETQWSFSSREATTDGYLAGSLHLARRLVESHRPHETEELLDELIRRSGNWREQEAVSVCLLLLRMRLGLPELPSGSRWRRSLAARRNPHGALPLLIFEYLVFPVLHLEEPARMWSALLLDYRPPWLPEVLAVALNDSLAPGANVHPAFYVTLGRWAVPKAFRVRGYVVFPGAHLLPPAGVPPWQDTMMPAPPHVEPPPDQLDWVTRSWMSLLALVVTLVVTVASWYAMR